MSAVDTPLSQKHATAAVTQPQEQASDDSGDVHSFTSIASSVEDQEPLAPENPNCITYTMLRDKTSKACDDPQRREEEITLYKSAINAMTGQEDSVTPSIGGVHFHHWLRDRSRSIIIRTRSGEADLKHPFGSSLGTHVLRLPSSGAEVKWVRAPFEDTNSSLRNGRRRKCVDVNNNTIALLVTNRSICAPKVHMAMTQVKEDLGRDDVEALLLSAAAMWLKAKKRALAGSQAGVAGCLGSVATLAVLG